MRKHIHKKVFRSVRSLAIPPNLTYMKERTIHERNEHMNDFAIACLSKKKEWNEFKIISLVWLYILCIESLDLALSKHFFSSFLFLLIIILYSSSCIQFSSGYMLCFYMYSTFAPFLIQFSFFLHHSTYDTIHECY